MLDDMNIHHRGLSEWALSKIPDIACRKILDIGCGGGMLISLLSGRFPDAEIFGVDISDEAVRATKELNKDLVNRGKCHISLDSVSELPFSDGVFDLVTAFETYFFWPDLDDDLRKAAGKVAENGCLVIVSETYPHPDFKEKNDETIRLYGLDLRDNDVMASMIAACGMDVTVHEVVEKNWVAFVGKK